MAGWLGRKTHKAIGQKTSVFTHGQAKSECLYAKEMFDEGRFVRINRTLCVWVWVAVGVESVWVCLTGYRCACVCARVLGRLCGVCRFFK